MRDRMDEPSAGRLGVSDSDLIGAPPSGSRQIGLDDGKFAYPRHDPGEPWQLDVAAIARPGAIARNTAYATVISLAEQERARDMIVNEGERPRGGGANRRAAATASYPSRSTDEPERLSRTPDHALIGRVRTSGKNVQRRRRCVSPCDADRGREVTCRGKRSPQDGRASATLIRRSSLPSGTEQGPAPGGADLSMTGPSAVPYGVPT